MHADWTWVDRDPDWEPAVIDTTVAHSARMYDYWLGGKTNFPADRELGDEVERIIPTIRSMARENRRFLGRAVRRVMREEGIDQFLDIGTGIPTEGNTHEVAQLENPDARVVYVDNDPIVLTHARALMVGSPTGRTAYVHADLRDPESILQHPALVETLDLGRPVALMLVSVLMLLQDVEDPWALVATLRDALPSGSCLVVSHVTGDFDPKAVSSVAEAENEGRLPLSPRSREAVGRFFGDWEMLEPGVVPVMAWSPDGPAPENPEAAYYWAGAARKPH